MFTLYIQWYKSFVAYLYSFSSYDEFVVYRVKKH